MTLATDLGLGPRELVAFVGGGGKSTLMLALTRELAGSRVLVTTTTKMGADQLDAVAAAGAEFLAAARDAGKVTGPPPDEIDQVFADGGWDYVLVEADGSRGRPLKVPAAHEPVIPQAATIVVVVMGMDAVGRPLAQVAHRPGDAAVLLGVGPGHVVTAEDCALMLEHPDGGMRGVPTGARVVAALTKDREGLAGRVAAQLGGSLRIERTVAVPVL